MVINKATKAPILVFFALVTTAGFLTPRGRGGDCQVDRRPLLRARLLRVVVVNV
jgi:hypothetical protein